MGYLAERIRRWRIEQGLTQAALAQKLGVSVATVARWESEKGYSPRLDLFQRLEDMGFKK